MLWIGAIFGALFGWIGILVAALFWATLAVIKLIWVLSVFAFQLLLAVGALLARAIIWLFTRDSKRLGAARDVSHAVPKATRQLKAKVKSEEQRPKRNSPPKRTSPKP